MAQTLANAIELIKKYSTEAWDKVYKAEARSSLLEGKDGKVQFSVDNARAVKVAKVSFGGLNDYERNNIEEGTASGLSSARGYKEAGMSLKWEERLLTQDRGAKYVIEKMDDEETAGLAVGSATTEINRTIVVPEVDAYCFSRIAEVVAGAGLGNYVTTGYGASALGALNAGFKWLDDNEVPEENQIVFISSDFKNALRSDSSVTKYMDVEGTVDHKVSFKIVSYEGRELIMVPPRRFKTAFAKRPNGGYYFGNGTLDINFIAMDKNAAVHVVKYHKQNILTGEAALANTDMDSTVLFVRIYHDVFVFDNKIAGIYVNVGGSAGATSTGIVSASVKIDTNRKVTDLIVFPADILTRFIDTTARSAQTGLAVGATYSVDSHDVELKVGATLSASAKVAVVQGGQIVAYLTIA